MKDLKNCWLKPDGQVVSEDREFWAEFAWHEELALCLLRDLWDLENKHQAFEKVHKKFSNTATEELENLGYVRLHGYGGLPPVWVLPIGKRLTKKQENTILDWCLANNVKFEKCFAK